MNTRAPSPPREAARPPREVRRPPRATREAPQGASRSRRDFLKQAGGGLSFALVFGPAGLAARSPRSPDAWDAWTDADPPDAPPAQHPFGAWVRIATDGQILIYSPAAEMGQGSMTALPVVLAEEMDADWDRVRIEHSPVEPAVYGRSWSGRGRGGSMMTAGSMAVRGYYMNLRAAGAGIRRVLLENVAREWGVPAGELTTEPGVVMHAASGRRISYGEIAAFAEVPDELPEVAEAELKSPEDFRLIGRSLPRHDVPAKTDGSAVYALDVRVPDMLYGAIARAPVHEASPASFNGSEVEALPGVVGTLRLDYGVGVIAETVEEAFAARDALEIDWAGGARAEGFDSVAALEAYAGIADGNGRGRPLSERGDVAAAMEAAAARYEADYLNDYVYHAQMEPLGAVASVNAAGDGAEVWAGTQAPDMARAAVARELGVAVERVAFHPCYLGGGLGRRTMADYIVEAVQLSRSVRRPVKLIWTREDDLQYGAFRPMSLQRLTAGVDDNGNPVAWTHTVVGDGRGLLASGISIQYYDIPNQRIEMRGASHGVRTKHWRAVGHGPNKFAIEAFVDDIARGEGIDPVELRRTLLGGSPRAVAVLDEVAAMSGWGDEPPSGRARGVAFVERSGTLAAGVAEVSVDETSGRIRVHRFWCAADGGTIVQPRNARAQIEGGIVNGLSTALFERLTLRDGRVEQSNFHDYPILRMSDMPEIDVRLLPSRELPMGMGEPGVPVAAGAVANAFASLTGRPLRHMPFTPERVLEALNG